MEATNAIINAIEATNATVDQLVQQGNELCDDVDNLRAADERLGKEVDAIRASVAANKKDISADKEAIASQAKDLAELRAAIASQAANKEAIADLRAIVEAQAKEIADLRAIISTMHATIEAQAKAVEASKDAIVGVASATPDMKALIARIPKPDAVRTRVAQTAAPVEAVVQPVEAVVVEAPAPVEAVVVEAPSKPAPRTQATTNAVETRAYARQYMIENGAKVEQLRDPAAIEATVQSDAFAAWLATR